MKWEILRNASWLALLLGISSGLAGTPGMISYQGLVSVNGTNFNGTGQFKFALVNGGTQTYWSHDGTSTGGEPPVSSLPVAVTKGLYSIMLGDTNYVNMTQPIPGWVFTNAEVYLRVWFDRGTGAQQLTPDQRIGSVAYALQSGSVDAGAIQAEMIADGAITGSKIAPGVVKSSHIDDGGSATYETLLAPAAALGASNALPFSSLCPVATNGEVGPAFAFTLDGARFGTVIGFVGHEAISEPYAFFIEVVLPHAELDPDAQLGRTGKLAFTRNGRSTAFSGLITGCSVSSQGGTNALYALRLESPLAYLALNTDYRIYQQLAVPEIATNLYQRVATDPIALSLTMIYPKRACAVQYAEPDLGFFNRLLEDEGLFYFFRANSGALIVADSAGAYLAAPNSPYTYLGDAAPDAPPGLEYIRSFHKAAHESTLTSTIATRDFTRPGISLVGKASSVAGRGERYQFGSSATTGPGLDRQARLRQDRQDVERATMSGASSIPDLRPGYGFTLNDRTESGFAGDYVVTGVRHAAFRRTGNGTVTLYYGNEFEVIPAALACRPAQKTAKPVAHLCTADVTGPTGGQTFLDKYGRVKVQFHWDRYGAHDETSSGWIRVASPVAGATHGMLFLPRVGDEVLVNFLQGDPDQPVIVGSVYNGAAMPPYALPDASAVSTIKSASASANVNEIRFNDTAGAEALEITTPKLVLSAPQLLIGGSPYTRSNSVLAWASVAADGSLSGNTYGVSRVANLSQGFYRVTLDKSAESASVVIPVAVAVVNRQPTTPAAARLVTVDQVLTNAFNVYVMSGQGTPTNSAFTVIVTGQ